MTPHSTPQDEETFSDTSTIIPPLNEQARHGIGSSLTCDDPEDDDPDDESPFGVNRR